MFSIALFVSCIYDSSDIQQNYCRGVCAANDMAAADNAEYTYLGERDQSGFVSGGTISCLCVEQDKTGAKYITVNFGTAQKKKETQQPVTMEKQ